MSDSIPTSFVAPDIHELAPLFPGYEIETLIATGGMGAVYRAVQRSLDRTVAIKILPREFSSDAAFCAGFESEAKAMAKLNHPNLIGVFDFGEVNGMLFIIMEYVPGKSLYHSSHHQAIDPREVIRIISAICHGLAHAHEHGILHRDIKPSNILLDQNAEPKIGDFGLARPVDRQVQEGEEIFGTPHYTAPEVLKPPYTVDHRADIFSVGVMLHELLTGKLPADDSRPASAICRCDPRFDAIIRRATHPSPQLRYASAAEIAAELSVIQGISRNPRTIAATSPRTVPTANPPRRSPPPTLTSSSSGNGIVTTFVILAALACAAYFFLAKPPANQPDTPPPPPATSETKPTPTAPVVPLPKEPSTTHHSPSELNQTPSETTKPSIPEPVDHSPEPSQPTTPPTEVTRSEPVFDVEGFFQKAVRIMQDKTKDVLANHAREADAEFADFEKALKRKARRAESGKEIALERVEAALETIRANDQVVPPKPPPNLTYIPEISEVFTEYHKNFEKLESSLEENLKSHANTYVVGIEYQIKRLNPSQDPVAVQQLQDEIDRTRQDPSHFVSLMRGETTPGQRRAPKKTQEFEPQSDAPSW